MDKSPFFEPHRCGQHRCVRNRRSEFSGPDPECNGGASSSAPARGKSDWLLQFDPRKSTVHISPQIGLDLQAETDWND